MDIFIAIGCALVGVDLFMTVFCKKPLFKPGPIAKMGHPNLNDNDGYI